MNPTDPATPLPEAPADPELPGGPDAAADAAPPPTLSMRPFSHLPPFDDAFAERVPVLQAFSLAIQNYLRIRRVRGSTLRGQVGRWVRPHNHVFQAVECGVFTGSSLLACAELARDAGIAFHLVGLDTFTGLPPLSARDRKYARRGARYLKRQMFTETSVQEVRDRFDAAGFARNVELRPGLFSDTLPTLPERQYSFVNVDCDLYEPHIECLRYFYPRMLPGGIVFFDDYHSEDYPMAGKAVDDFMQNKPEKLMHLRYGEDAPNRTKSFFIKY